MKTKLIYFASILSMIILAISCTQDPKSTDATTQSLDEDQVNINISSSNGSTNININSKEDLVKTVNETIENLNLNNDGVESINYKEIQEKFPKSFGDYILKDTDGSSTNFGSISFSTASAIYVNNKNQNIDISITDSGGVGSTIASLEGFSDFNISQESDDGYQKTITWEGHKAFLQYDNKTKETKFTVLYNERFVVNATGIGMSPEKLKSFIKAIDLESL